MKKAALVIIALILATGSLWAIDPRLSAMGDIGVSVSGTKMQSYPNPAAVFFDESKFTFAIRGRLRLRSRRCLSKRSSCSAPAKQNAQTFVKLSDAI